MLLVASVPEIGIDLLRVGKSDLNLVNREQQKVKDCSVLTNIGICYVTEEELFLKSTTNFQEGEKTILPEHSSVIHFHKAQL